MSLSTRSCWWLWCVLSSTTRNCTYRRAAAQRSQEIHARLYRLSVNSLCWAGCNAWDAVLSAGGAQHAARRGSGGGGTVVGVVVIGWWAREDGVTVGRGAVELESPQILGVDGFVALQHFDGLLHSEPLPLTACRGRQTTMWVKGGFHKGFHWIPKYNKLRSESHYLNFLC